MSTEITVAIISAAAIIIAAAITSPIAFRKYQEHQELTYGKEVAIQVSDGTYLKVDNGGTLIGNPGIYAWSMFTIVEADPSPNKPTKTINDGDRVRFKAKFQGEWKYVSMRWENKEQKPLQVQSANLDALQIFIICTTPKNKPGVFHYGSHFALKAHNRCIVSYDLKEDGKQKKLFAIHGHIKESETFVFVTPPHAKSDH